MRKISRQSISPAAQKLLVKRSRAVQALPSSAQTKEVIRLWAMQRNKALMEVRSTLRRMAPGLNRCMYCEDSEGTDIEHFRPKSKFPMTAFTWENMLWACSGCNSNYKREEFPLDSSGSPLLINPTVDNPAKHLTFVPDTGDLVPLDPIGRESVRVFHLDRQTLVRGRRNAWLGLICLVKEYGTLMKGGQIQKALEIKRVICEHPFSCVFEWFIFLSKLPTTPKELFDSHVRDALDSRPEIFLWQY